MLKEINKVLIANRGEIACRITRTLDKKGIKSVAIYSEADKNALHVEMASEAHYAGPSPAIESYLKIDTIIEIAKKSGSDAIHPGYGFLSENPLLAEACQKNDILFIGPSAAAIRAMGSKSEAKKLMERSGVPLIPGYHGDDQSDATLLDAAISIGFPVILKAALGGGGKGMRIVTQESEFNTALQSCRREAKSSFNDETILIEKYIGKPRHVEVQIFFDQHGNGVHLFDRDCSVQRRHQKIVEEAPAPNIPDKIRSAMAEAAIMAGKSIDYVGAGTVEFLYDGNDNYYFMEMNTRLQVEHPVTEMVTGLDLVEWQIEVASGKPLPLKQDEIAINGHSIEVRLCAENCSSNFMPSIGPIKYQNVPLENRNIRLDNGMKESDQISVYYDPMFAKLISWGRTRDEAIRHLSNSMDQMIISGVESNCHYLKNIVSSEKFGSVTLSTDFLDDIQYQTDPTKVELRNIAIAASVIRSSKNKTISEYRDPSITYNWMLNMDRTILSNLIIDGELHTTTTSVKAENQFRVTIGSEVVDVFAQYRDRLIKLHGDIIGEFYFYGTDNDLTIVSESAKHNVKDQNTLLDTDEVESEKRYLAPMPGIVTKVFFKEGDSIKEGDAIVVVEAMKMENIVYAKANGVLDKLFYQEGATVSANGELFQLSE